MSPHANDLDRAFRVDDLIDEPVLDVDPTGIGALEVPDQLFKRRRALPRIPVENIEKPFGLVAKSATGDLMGVFLRLSGKDDLPWNCRVYQPGFSDVLESGVRSPFRIDSRIPGIARRYKVS